MSYEVAAKLALETDATMGTVAAAICRKSFGDEFYFWDPATVYLELRDEFGAEPSTAVMDRISAAQLVVSSNSFFEFADAFMNVCNTLSSGSPGFAIFDPVEVEEAAWAITEVSFLRELEGFSPAIRSYIRLILEKDGYDDTDYPDVFDYVLGKKQLTSDAYKDVLNRTLHDEKRDGIEAFIMEQMQDMVYQFDKIPGMDDVFQQLLKDKDLEELADFGVLA